METWLLAWPWRWPDQLSQAPVLETGSEVDIPLYQPPATIADFPHYVDIVIRNPHQCRYLHLHLDTMKSTGKVLCHLQNYKLIIICMISSRLSDNDTMLQF